MRVLHLIQPGVPGGGACTLRLLAEPMARLTSVQHDVIVIGPQAHAKLARRCGVEVVGAICPPGGAAVLARRALARVIELREAAAGRYDLVHAWSLPAAVLAAQAAPERPRLATVSVGPVTDLATQVNRMFVASHDLPILATSSAVAAEWQSLGVPASQLAVLPPAVNPGSTPMTSRRELRRRWRVDDDTLVVGLLSEPLLWADARDAGAVVVRAAIAGRRLRLLVHPRAPRCARAIRWAESLGLSDLVIVDDAVAEPWHVVRGLDAALLLGGDLNTMDLRPAGAPLSMLTGGGRRLRPMPGIMPLLWLMAVGVPVIAEASDAVRDVIRDGEDGLLVPHRDHSAACDRLIRIADDPTIANRIGANARRRVETAFGVSAYCVRLKAAYQSLVEGPETFLERFTAATWNAESTSGIHVAPRPVVTVDGR